MITNKEIGKIARKVGSVDTKSYSEVRGGRRVKKYRMSFGLKHDALKFIEIMKERNLPIPYVRGYSYDTYGYILEYIREEVATEKELKREEELKDLRRMPKNPTWEQKCGSILKPQYELNNRPDSVIVQDEEVAEIAEYILGDCEWDLELQLECFNDFLIKDAATDLRNMFTVLAQILEDKVIKLNSWTAIEVADHFYGAEKNFNWSKKQ